MTALIALTAFLTVGLLLVGLGLLALVLWPEGVVTAWRWLRQIAARLALTGLLVAALVVCHAAFVRISTLPCITPTGC